MTLRAGLAAWLLLALTALACAEPVFPRAGSVGLEPPRGMAVADSFLGFQKGKASILVTELPPAAYAQIDAARDQFAAKVEGGRLEPFPAAGAKGFVVRGRQSLAGTTFRKWAVVLGAPAVTALVTVQVPVEDRSISDQAVEAALRSLALRAPPSLDEKVAALPFAVGDRAGFRVVNTLTGSGLILTEGPKDEDPDSEQPSVIIATSLDRPAPLTGREAFAKAYLQSIKALRVSGIESTRLLKSGGVEWAEVRAKASRGKGGSEGDRPVDVALFLRFDKSGFLTIVGTVPSGRTGYAERFRRLALSVGPRT